MALKQGAVIHRLAITVPMQITTVFREVGHPVPKRILSGLLGVLVLSAITHAAELIREAEPPASTREVGQDFDAVTPDALPPGWSANITGEGTPHWRIMATDDAPSGRQVLQQAATVPKASFPLCLLDAPSIGDGFVEVRFKPESGKEDQAGGVIWRARDRLNYYVCRANALEGNVVLYQVQNGKRTPLDVAGRPGAYGVNVSVAPAKWHTLRVDFSGQRFQAFLDGKPVCEAVSTTFPEAGRVGLWTKADSVTSFDSFRCGTKPAPIYLSDTPGLLLNQTQGWGELGFNTAAHAPSIAGEPLRVAGQTYSKGLGHHATGRIWVALDGAFASFHASVGLQPCTADGSVNFRVLVDGDLRFESGVMHTADPAKRVQVDTTGAQELVLESLDAGDSITCDMANWVDARLIPSTTAHAAPRHPQVDMAPFARVITGDPERTNGCQAHRLEEFRAEDLDLDVDLLPSRGGGFVLKPNASGQACIGLAWFNTRSIRELRLRFPPGVQIPEAAAVRLQGWFGESAWQGQWRPLDGTLTRDGLEWVFQPGLSPGRSGPLQTRKVRWTLPAPADGLAVGSLSAFTRSRWDEVEVVAEFAGGKGRRGEWRVFNGEVVEASQGPGVGPPHEAGAWRSWDLSRPLHVKVRYARPSSFKGDETMLQFRLPEGGVGVRVADLFTNDAVDVPARSLFVTRAATGLNAAAYRTRIAGRKGILDEVRKLPEQTFEQAMAKTHHAAQEEGPVMLSLACANTKFVVERDGTVRFPGAPLVNEDWAAAATAITVQFQDGRRDRFERRLEGGWLPQPVITSERNGLVLSERIFVAPDAASAAAVTAGTPSVCVIEFTLSNPTSEPGDVRFALQFNPPKGAAAVRLDPTSAARMEGTSGPTSFAVVSEEGSPIRSTVEGAKVTWQGRIPGGGKARTVVFLRDQPGSLPGLGDVTRLQAAMAGHWTHALARSMQIETPEARLNDIIRSSQVRCLIAARNEAGGQRIAAWIAAMSYGPLESEAHSVIRGMDFMGHHEFAQRALDFFVHRYNTNGFLTTGYTTFGTAWHLWTLGEHASLTADREWVRGIAPELGRVGDWIVSECDKTRRRGVDGRPVPGSGLMPPAVMADWNSYAMHFMLNGYYHAALRELGTALRGINDRRARLFTKRAEVLRRDLLTAYRWTQDQSPALPLRDGTWIPHYPSQVHSPGPLADFFPGDDAGRAWAYDVELGAHQLVPTGVLSPGDPEVARIMAHMEDVQFLGEGWFDYPAAANAADWFNLGGFAKVQPFYARNVEIDALRDDVKPFLRSYFNGLASLLNTEVLSLWEHFRHSGAWDKTHETGYFLHQTRLMLVQERGTELWLAPFIPGSWLRGGRGLSVGQAPTRFGPVSFRIEPRPGDGIVEAVITAPERSNPSAIVLRLRDPKGRLLSGVELDGKGRAEFTPQTGVIRLRGARGVIHVRAIFQTK